MDARWLKDESETPTVPIVEVDADDRRSLRRALPVPCDVVSHYWEHPVAHEATDLSLDGMWIDTLCPLHRGAEVVVSFLPPRWSGGQLMVFARVARVNTGRRRRDRGRVGMGLEFADLTLSERVALQSSLCGVPPRLWRAA
jgi:hypothetical protein